MGIITAFCFHPTFYPPRSGGEERVFYLYYYLSQIHEITLITFCNKNDTNSPEFIYHTDTFLEIRIPKTQITDIAYKLINKWSNIVECSAIVCTIESFFNIQFQKIGRERIINADYVIFEYPYLCTFPKRIFHKKTVCYDSHNFEFGMMVPILNQGVIGKFLLLLVQYIEKKVMKLSDIIFCVSDSDRNDLLKKYSIKNKNPIIIPNGVEVSSYNSLVESQNQINDKKIGIFTGSFHPPNISAINNLMSIADNTPEIHYVIIGSASNYFLSRDNFTEQSIFASDFLEEKNQIIALDNIHPYESWGAINVIWTKPIFHILLSKKILQVKVSFFSPYEQVLHGSINSGFDFNISSGWNTIDVSNNGESSLNFSCSVPHFDEHRSLGIAISEIAYYMDGNWALLKAENIPGVIQCIKDHPNITLLGKVTEEEKKYWYQKALFAVNPMTEGSGSNLKVLGYLAAGVPVITTQKGARGLSIEDGINGIICDLEKFPEKITELLSDKLLYQTLVKNGKELVEKEYDWKIVTSIMSNKLNKIKKILVLNDFPIYPIDHGGKIRIFNIYKGLSQFFDITYLCFTKENIGNIREISPSFREISIPMNSFQKYILYKFKENQNISGDDILTLVTGFTNRKMKKTIRKEIQTADAVVFIHPYMFPFIKLVKKKIPIIHESLNVEWLLKKSFFAENFHTKFLMNRLFRSEMSLLHNSNIIFSVSKEDANALSLLYNIDISKIYISPNGVDINQYPINHKNTNNGRLISKPLIIFIGSGHHPNVLAAERIIREIAPNLPSFFFMIIGSVCWAIQNEIRGSNVGLGYLISDEEKIELFLSANIAINPMISGSGTNLKMLDYMAAGLPVISTQIGARGLDLINGEHLIICNLNDFPKQLVNLIENSNLSNKIASNGTDFVKEKYSWNVIVENMANTIKEMN